MIRVVPRVAVIGSMCVALLVLSTSTATAKPASCAVLEIHAKKGPPKMAKALPPKLARQLRRPPFSSWKNFRVVRAVRRVFADPGVRHKIGLQRGSLMLHRLPNANNQYKLLFVLKNPRGKRVLRTKVGVSPKTYFLVAGLRLEPGSRDGIQVIALSCMPK